MVVAVGVGVVVGGVVGVVVETAAAETVGGVGHWDKESRSSSRASAAPASTSDRG